MPDPSTRDKAGDGDAQSNLSVLGYLVQRITSQPMLLAIAVLLILSSVAAASIDSLRALLPVALTIFVVAIAAWVVVEVMRFRRQAPKSEGENVRVTARRVGKEGEVFGVDDESGSPAAGSTSVKIKADDVQGRVTGIRRGPRRP
jgi:membrane protein implicated in regulation of membrane protease activity